MKKYLFLLLSSVVLLSFVGCDDDDSRYSLNNYWVGMATVEAPQASGFFILGATPFWLKTDGGTSLWPAALNSYLYWYRSTDKQRVLVNYTLLSDAQEGYDHFIRLNDLRNVLTKNVDTLRVSTPADSPLRGQAPIRMNNVWIADNYINIVFSYQASYGSVHYFNLIVDEIGQITPNPDAGVVSVRLVHDAKGDGQEAWFKGIVSFLVPVEWRAGITAIAITSDNFGTAQKVVCSYRGSTAPTDSFADLTDQQMR